MKIIKSFFAITITSIFFSITPAVAQDVKLNQSKVDSLAKELGLPSELLTKRLITIISNLQNLPSTAKSSYKINGKQVDLNSLIDSDVAQDEKSNNPSDEPSFNALTRPRKGYELAEILGITPEQAIKLINSVPEGLNTFKTHLSGVDIDLVEFKEAKEELTIGAIDLGLSVKWASCNLDATSPEQVGKLYAWGELKTKTKYTPSLYTVHFDNGFETLPANNDVAHRTLGGKWRMPTKEEFEELIENCTRKWTTYNGKRGIILTSKINGNSIFLPAVGYSGSSYMYNPYEPDGYYWSSSPAEFGSNYISGPEKAYAIPTWVYRLRFDKNGISCNKATTPENGLPIRPVCY